nr:immunoglobulin heavy chain junction region [Macaca mulatta]MOX58687.1 immunoglobulin heavy chain junction region [Macaca mulatta]MOX59990.1 immunoglobulin heavy chain junction region [Macaca mulatta]MOX60377.1 immunoglobulin heavy chain junction region [Macaca mulatta]MOX61694.1 immunoglobulin heavy chain junction region [Macaca mulatta]
CSRVRGYNYILFDSW